MNGKTLLVMNEHAHEAFLQKALDIASTLCREITVLQILDSPLYHYGHNDLLAGGRSKTAFLLHVRKEVLDFGRQQAHNLYKKARERLLDIQLRTFETEDPARVVMVELEKGYEVVLFPFEPRRLFPLFHKTLPQRIRRQVKCRVIEI